MKILEKNKKDIQHSRFPCSPLPKYWSGLRVLNFAVRMGCGAFTLVWSHDEQYETFQYSRPKFGTLAKKSSRYSYVSCFLFSRGRDIVGLLLSVISQASRPNVGFCYLNSIRKSWLDLDVCSGDLVLMTARVPLWAQACPCTANDRSHPSPRIQHFFFPPSKKTREVISLSWFLFRMVGFFIEGV